MAKTKAKTKVKSKVKKEKKLKLGTFKETAREKLIGQHIGYRSVSYTHLTLPTNREV